MPFFLAMMMAVIAIATAIATQTIIMMLNVSISLYNRTIARPASSVLRALTVTYDKYARGSCAQLSCISSQYCGFFIILFILFLIIKHMFSKTAQNRWMTRKGASGDKPNVLMYMIWRTRCADKVRRYCGRFLQHSSGKADKTNNS